jgi:hypothetical protein
MVLFDMNLGSSTRFNHCQKKGEKIKRKEHVFVKFKTLDNGKEIPMMAMTMLKLFKNTI